MAATCPSPMFGSEKPKHCPECSKKGVISKVKKTKLFSRKAYLCINDGCTWPLTKDQLVLLSTAGWEALEHGLPLAHSTPNPPTTPRKR